jgi:TolB-like protein
MTPASRLARLLAELKRRHVYRVTAIYVVLAIGGLEVSSMLLPTTRLPGWFDELFLGLAIVGLPLVVVLAWTFDITETGIERTPDQGGEGAGPRPAPAGPRTAAESTAPEAGDPEIAAHRSAAGTLDPLTVAVLPFENLSGSDAAAPFALGLHDDLLTELSRASALTVISRTSVRGYLGSTLPLPVIARELGAGTIVEGGVQQAGSRVRLNVQLIDASTDQHLWAERYDRELTTENIFELQSELAGHIMGQLRATLTAAEAAVTPTVPTSDLEAYQLLVTGRECLVDRSETGFRRAAELFERAVELDPHYALAWAGLADALIGLVDYRHSDSHKELERGAAACRRALDLDPNLAEGHAAWGRYRTAMRDAPGSVRAHARAAELQPSYAGAHQWSCWASLLMGLGEDAARFGAKAVQLDPLDPEAAGNLAVAWLMTGEPHRALAEADRILEHHPTFEYGIWAKALGLQALERWGEAAETLRPLADRWAVGWPELGRAVACAAAGDEDGVRAELEALSGRETGFERGMMHALLGDHDRAFALVRSEWPLPWAETLYLYVHRGPPITGLAGDARFEPFLDEVRNSWRMESA